MGRGLGQGCAVAAGLAFALHANAARPEEAAPWRASAQGVVDSANFGSTLPVLPHGPSSGAYLLAEIRLWTGQKRYLDGLFRFGTADSKTDQIGRHLTADVVLRQPFGRGSGEALGIGVVSALKGDQARRADAASGLAAHREETTIEATDRARRASSLSLQPDVRYVIHPGAVRGRKNALVIGVRLAFGAAIAP